MTERIVVTGASGLLGANICRLAAADGRRVVGMVRKESDAAVLRALGVEAVLGDVVDVDSLDRALASATGIIHCAAVIGGTWSHATEDDYESVNYQGTVNVLDRAEAAGVARTVIVSSMVIADMSVTVTERSPLLPVSRNASGYLKSKLSAYYYGMHRAARGQHVTFVLPAGMYGPSPFIDRVLEPTLFTGTLYRAITGEITEYARFPLPWPYADDAARTCIAALDNGRSGARYLAGGRAEDVCSLPEFCNVACAEAGVDRRVADLDPAEIEIGSMKAMAATPIADPLLDPSWTNDTLGIQLTPLDVGIAQTVRWLRDQGRLT